MPDFYTQTITNANKKPIAFTPTQNLGGRLKSSVEVFNFPASGIANGDVIHWTFLDSEARVSAIRVNHGAVAGLAANIGVYDIPDNGGKVVDASLFGGGHTFTSAEINAVIAPQTPKDCNKPIWQLLGLPANPHKKYELCLTITAAPTAAADVAMEVQYVDGN
jgi:hypothetical protein